MGYWKTNVLPKIKKVFEKDGTKKAAAAEITKSFDESKEEHNKTFEENKIELQSKVVKIYEASSTEIKSLVKEHDEAGLKKHSKAVNNFLEELVKIDFPGSKPVYEASSKFGPALISGPVFFVFEKVSTFIVTEEKVDAPTETKTEEETSTTKEKEIVIAEEKKEEKQEVVETIEKTESSEPPKAEPAKVEEQVGEPSKVEEKHAEVPVTVEKVEAPKP
ncbi:hypothetical protein TanjilG_15046 [Lupinus angustifolius]|uniref:Plasma membrane-associated cation-binding protein 1 n=1 Tax=Lupinus angustifolius TaxID=3871 RepID=A0A1J7FVS3_LUPAN|nr:PREDICTED: plasma membrane-associated cation-binding protein 1-like [Lupinus angustifolius]OIV92055.1 hypothetical protein TanjilG_15046 [Lupinus angustifolius]